MPGNSEIASLMILVSGAAHAVVNAILKAGRDKLSSRALMDGFSALLLLPFAFVLPLPHGAWSWLACSALVHLVYLIALVRAYESADMSVAYPVARGTAPALSAVAAVGFFGESIDALAIGGIALVSSGVILIGLGRRVNARALRWALLTAVCIALYTVIDAQGVRRAPSAPSYIVWVFLILGCGIALLFALWRGPKFLLAAREQWRAGLCAGILSIVTYGLALWAFRLGNTPRLAALRETSILFGALLAVCFLHECLSPTRWIGTALIACGAVLLVAL